MTTAGMDKNTAITGSEKDKNPCAPEINGETLEVNPVIEGYNECRRKPHADGGRIRDRNHEQTT